MRDRPLLQFQNGHIACVYPELIVEKITPAIFWWTTAPDKKQETHWKVEWGYVAEAYATFVLEQIAKATGCQFAADVKGENWQIDAVMWNEHMVALFEVSTATLTDAVAMSGDMETVRAALRKAFIESERPGKPPEHEAVFQLKRDVTLLRDGVLQKVLPLAEIERVYPVLISFDRRLQTPGLWFYLDYELHQALPNDLPWPVAPLAALTIEDLEGVESLAMTGKLKGSPPGLLKLLRLWEAASRRREAWWLSVKTDYTDIPDNPRLKATGDEWIASMKKWFK